MYAYSTLPTSRPHRTGPKQTGCMYAIKNRKATPWVSWLATATAHAAERPTGRVTRTCWQTTFGGWFVTATYSIIVNLERKKQLLCSQIQFWFVCFFLTLSTSHVWNLRPTEDVHLHTPALQIGTHFLLTLETIIVFLFHLLSATSKPFSSLSTRPAHAARLGFFLQKRAI